MAAYGKPKFLDSGGSIVAKQLTSNTSHISIPKRAVRRQLLAVPPTPVTEDATLTQMLLNQNDIQISNTPSERCQLPPMTPTDFGKNKGTEQLHTTNLPLTKSVNTHPYCKRRVDIPIQYQINPPVQYVVDSLRSRLECRQLENTPRSCSDKRPGYRSFLLDGDLDYKHTRYLDACSYSKTISEDTELKIIKRYLQGKIAWSKVTKIIASKEVKIRNKKPRLRKGP